MGPDSLPANAAGCSSADIIAVSQDALDGSKPLRYWLASGGIVIVPGLPLLEAPAYVPASAILQTAKSGKVPIIKLTGRPNGQTLLAHGAMPLVYEQRVGLGKVIYLAFNPSDRALLKQPAYDILWRQILQSACSGRAARHVDGPWDATWLERMSRQGMKVDPPKVHMIASFLGAYILLLIPVNYFVLRRLRRKELAWITIPALVIIFSLFAYAAGSVSREKKLIAGYAQVFETAAGSGAAEYHGNLSLMSPNRSRHTIEFPDPSALVSDTGFGGSAGAFPILQSVRPKQSVILPDTHLFMWSVRTLAFQGIRPMPGIVSADLTTDGARVKGTISSSLSFPLKDCILYGDRFEKEIGELLPGAIIRIDEPYKLVFKGVRNRPYDQHIRHFPWNTRLTELNPERLTLSGTPESKDGRIPIEGAKVDLSFDISYVHIYPRWVNGPDGKVTGSVAGVTSDHDSYYGSTVINGSKAIHDGRLEATIQLFRNTDCVMQYRLPPFAALAGLSLYLGLDHPAPIQAQAFDNQAQKWVELGSLSKSGRLPIPNPRRVIGRGGVVEIRLKSTDTQTSTSVNVNARLEFQGRVK